MPILDAIGAKKLVEDILSDAYKNLKSAISSIKIDAQVIFKSGIEDYLLRSYDGVCSVKTLVSPDKSLNIGEIYVAPKFQLSDRILSDEAIYRSISDGSRCIITGIAGQGKSVYLKWLFARFSAENRGRIPFFIQLREFSESIESIEQWIKLQIAGGRGIDQAYIEELLRVTPMLVLLDGLDEVAPVNRRAIRKLISDFSDQFPNAAVFLTSRPDREFVSWNRFKVLRISNYDSATAKRLVRRFPVDSRVKQTFIARMEDEYFAKYPSLFANPLLIGMMFITFWKNNYIPEKEHLIYEKAFDALHFMHDQTKFLYKRPMYSGLGEDDFRKYWIVFCFVSYLDGLYKLGNKDIKNVVSKVNNIANFSVDADLYIKDLTESVCMLIDDGDEYAFIHRSFQEYFCARYFMENSLRALVRAMAICGNRYGDNMIAYCKTIDELFFIKNYVKPSLIVVKKFIEDNDAKINPDLYYKAMYEEIVVDIDPDYSKLSSGLAISFTLSTSFESHPLNAYSNIYNPYLDRSLIDSDDERDIDWFYSEFEEDRDYGGIRVNLRATPASKLRNGPLVDWVKADYLMITALIDKIDAATQAEESELSNILYDL